MLINFIKSGDDLILVMEYLRGRMLFKHLEEEKELSFNRIIEITTQILKGLEDIHKTGLIHRDLKPDNVMIMDERIVIMDLGVIKDFNASTSITGGKFLGTIKYTAPEYLLNGISYTFRNISRLSKCSKLLDAYCSYYSFLFLRFS